MAVGGQVGGGVLLDSDYDDEGRCWGYEWIPEKKKQEEEKHGNNFDQATMISTEEVEVGDSRPDWLQNE